jgi:DNA-binding winged helix-turn-helix (wHTH) protein/tetratricopeptide (TPR) repeat protein
VQTIRIHGRGKEWIRTYASVLSMLHDKRAALRTVPSSRQRVTNDHGARDADINATITPGHRDHPGVRPACAIHIERPRTGIAVMPKKPTQNQSHFRVGDAMVYPDRLVIAIHGGEHAVEPLVMKVLVALANAKVEDQVLSAVELYIRVWIGTSLPEGHGIEGSQAENPVHKAITQLRKVFGDDPKTPRYIETIRKRGYRLAADVAHLERYQRSALPRKIWEAGSPYVGLNAFDSRHAEVFLGRSRTTGDLLMAMRHQMEQQRRLVLVVGASGSGKTSLLNAGLIPIVTKKGGYEGLQSLGVARCDLAGTHREDAMEHLSAALMEWTLEAHPVFQSQSARMLAEDLRTHPEAIPAALEEAMRCHAGSEMDRMPHAHLLLVIDHAEALVADPSFGRDVHAEIDRFLHHLCESRYACVIMVVRGDFYLALAEALPGVTERKSGDGHLDVLAPRTGEISEIIRIPAARAGLVFERDPDSGSHLDDVLRDAAASQPDALPLLQHTLQALYELRSSNDELRFSVYRDIGGLEGALALRAEGVLGQLPPAATLGLDRVLSMLIVMQPENNSISARRILRSTLDDEELAIVEAFVKARLFVAELDGGSPGYRVTHEALLRQWPRAVEWARENRRMLLARVRLQRSAVRWTEAGRLDDHLLNAGGPLTEAIEVARWHRYPLSTEEIEFVTRSRKANDRKILAKRSAIASLVALSAASTLLSVATMKSRLEAESRKQQGIELIGYMLQELGDQLRPTANIQALESISIKSLSFLESQPISEMNQEDKINYSRALRTRGEILAADGKLDEADTLFSKSNRVAIEAYRMDERSTDALTEVGQTAFWLGLQHRNSGRETEARKHWSLYEKIANSLVLRAPDKSEFVMERAFASANLAVLDLESDRCESAMTRFPDAIESIRRATHDSPGNAPWKYSEILARSWESRCRSKNGEIRESHREHLSQISDLQKIVIHNPHAMEWIQQLSSLQHFAAISAQDLGRTAEAKSLIEQSISNLEFATRAQPSKTQWKRNLASAWMKLGDLHSSTKDLASAQRAYRKSSSICREIDSIASSSTWIRLDASIRTRISMIENDMDSMNEAIQVLQRLFDASPNSESNAIALTQSLIINGNMHLSNGEHAKAKSAYARAHRILEEKALRTKDPRILAPWLESTLRASSATAIADATLRQLKHSGFSNPEYSAITAATMARQGTPAPLQ